ncbi:MAG: exo-alpha-sialidase [Clostridia bacterium]|nr:exo-alpha-sialidase [Clostridia bacterium]
MKKNNLFIKALSLILASLSLLTAFSACSNEKSQDEIKKEYLDISGYMIVRRDAASQRIVNDTINLKKAIHSKLGTELTVNVDWYNPSNAPDPNAKEILIDKTNRKESEEALAKLEGMPDDSYIIDVTENKIVIVGQSETGTVRAIAYFLNNYVLSSEEANKIDISAGKTYTKEYDIVQNIFIEDKLDMDVEVKSTLFEVPEKGYVDLLGYKNMINTAHYPAVLELKHQKNKEDNGKLIAIFCLSASPIKGQGPKTNGSVWESTDKGASWNLIARPEEMLDKSIGGISMAHIYELPAQVGDMPAGTLLYSGNSVNYSVKSHIGVWRSFDAGKTWEEYVIIAKAGGLKEGIWEPFMWYEESDGYLYCFYSDDSDPKHDQKLVYKRSKDGVKWSEIYDVCTFDNPADRPGMFSMTKMSNGEYFMVYEYVGTGGSLIYYKTTTDITNWNHTDPGTLLQVGNYSVGSAPWCIWSPAGGECGTLIATGMWEKNGNGQHRMFVSFDYGKTWNLMANPLPYDNKNDAKGTDRIGYSPCLVLGSDPSIVYYINTTDTPEGLQRIQFARLKLYEQ